MLGRHMFFTTEETKLEVIKNVDQYADSYARDAGVQELLCVGFRSCRCFLASG